MNSMTEFNIPIRSMQIVKVRTSGKCQGLNHLLNDNSDRPGPTIRRQSIVLLCIRKIEQDSTECELVLEINSINDDNFFYIKKCSNTTFL